MKKESSTTEITVRDAEEHDSPRLLAMISALAAQHGDVAKISPEVLERDAFGSFPWIYTIVAEAQGTVIGYAVLCPLIKLEMGMRGIDLHHLFVEKKWRGFGVGRTLINASRKKARELFCEYMVVGTHPDNIDAQSVYLACGFEQRQSSNPRFRIMLQN